VKGMVVEVKEETEEVGKEVGVLEVRALVGVVLGKVAVVEMGWGVKEQEVVAEAGLVEVVEGLVEGMDLVMAMEEVEVGEVWEREEAEGGSM
ncbi:hypothetical protein CEUSTIGMA_g13976.t1, partial [Chlamydomonas eustigma]